jgi:hypothetical protein
MTTTARDDISAYVEQVRAALADLPEATVLELIEDLPEHLAEVLADDAGSLTERLGAPEAYAAELRAAAGFVGGFPDPPTDGGRPPRLARARARAAGLLHTADVKIGPALGYAKASDFLQLLRPAWWVLRGYLAAMVVAWVLDNSGRDLGLLPRLGGSLAVAVVLLAAGVVGSIWLGRSDLGRQGWQLPVLRAGTAVLVLAGLVVFFSADRKVAEDRYNIPVSSYQRSEYDDIQDVFVYDSHGNLVQGAHLYDQDGRPIDLGYPSCDGVSEPETVVENPEAAGYPYCKPRWPGAPADPSVSPSVTGSAAPGSAVPPGPRLSETPSS